MSSLRRPPRPLYLLTHLPLRRLSDLPYLDAKVDYVHESGPSDIMDMDAPTISLDKDNTVESLCIQLAKLYDEGSGGGFPIVAKEDGGLRMYGYIAAKELEHGLASAAMQPSSTPCTFRTAASLQSGVPLPASRAATPSSVDFSWLIETCVSLSSSKYGTDISQCTHRRQPAFADGALPRGTSSAFSADAC